MEEVEPNPSDLPPRMARQRPSNGDGNDLVVDRGVKKKAHRRQDPFADMSAVEFLQANQDYIVHPNDAFDDEGDEGGDDDDIERDCEWTKKRDRFSLPPPASPPPPVVQPRRPAEESYGPQQPAEETYQPATPGETNVPTNDLCHRTLLASSTLDEHPTRKRKLSDTATGEAEPAISRRRSSALPPGTSTGPPQPSSLPSNLNIGSSPQFSPVPEHLILRSSSRETPYNLRIRHPNVPDHLILRSSTPISPHHQSHDPEQTVRRAKSHINLGPGHPLSSQSTSEPARQAKSSRVLRSRPTVSSQATSEPARQEISSRVLRSGRTVSSQSTSETTSQTATGHHVAGGSEGTQEPGGAQDGVPGNSKPRPSRGKSNSKN